MIPLLNNDGSPVRNNLPQGRTTAATLHSKFYFALQARATLKTAYHQATKKKTRKVRREEA